MGRRREQLRLAGNVPEQQVVSGADRQQCGVRREIQAVGRLGQDELGQFRAAFGIPEEDQRGELAVVGSASRRRQQRAGASQLIGADEIFVADIRAGL